MIFTTFMSVGKLSMASTLAGEGTEASPYLIATVEDLYSIPNSPEAHYKLVADLDLGETIRLPIAEFKGVLDGDGYTIKNLYINNQYSSTMGLFSKFTNAEVKNLTVADAFISTKAHNVGALVGTVTGSTISNCHVVGGQLFTLGTCAGGLVGNILNSELFQCSSTANVDTVSSYVGGLAGYVGHNVNVTQCYAKASVKGVNHVGGLIGFNTTSLVIKDSYAASKVVSSGTDSYATGLTYSNALHSMENCYSASILSGPNKVGLGMGLTGSSYFNADRAGMYTPAAEARNAAQMYSEANYVGWDFENVWMIQEGDAYPTLRFAVAN